MIEVVVTERIEVDVSYKYEFDTKQKALEFAHSVIKESYELDDTKREIDMSTACSTSDELLEISISDEGCIYSCDNFNGVMECSRELADMLNIENEEEK